MPTTPRPIARDPRIDRWAVALFALPFVSGMVCILVRSENIAEAVLPAADGPIPLVLVGALWVVLPAMITVLLLRTLLGDDLPPLWARALALLVTAWIGTVTFFPQNRSDSEFETTFGSAAPQVEAVGGGIAAGIVGILCAIMLTGIILRVAYRRPTDWDERTPEAREAHVRSLGSRLTLLFLGLLVVVLVVVALLS